MTRPTTGGSEETPETPTLDPSDPTAVLLSLAEKELQGLLAKKRQTEKTLAAIESNIYVLEGSYLEESSQFGNIIRGFEGYLSSRPERKRARMSETDRIFSSSSVTFRMMDDDDEHSPLKSGGNRRDDMDRESSPDSEEYFPSQSLSRPNDKNLKSLSARKSTGSWKKRQRNRKSVLDEDDDSEDEADSLPDEED